MIELIYFGLIFVGIWLAVVMEGYTVMRPRKVPFDRVAYLKRIKPKEIEAGIEPLDGSNE